MSIVIILAAGKGERLFPKTKNLPKTLLKIQSKTVLTNQIDLLKNNGLTNIFVVTGYKKEKIEGLKTRYNFHTIHNSKFDKTNMVHSLFVAINDIKNFNEDIIITYGDIIYNDKVIKKVKECKSPISVVVDLEWHKLWKMRMANPLDDAETLVKNKRNFIKDIGRKTKDLTKIQGQYIGIIKIRQSFLKDFISFYKALKISNKKSMYMTDLLQLLINSKFDIKAILIKGGWFEFDTLKDLKLYKEMKKIN